MKRISCYIFIVVLLFLVIGCEGLGTTQKCNHIWGEWNIVTEATCAKNGLKQQTCTLCSKTNEEVIPITDEHNYVEEKIEQELTCVVDEVVVYTCSVCGNSKKEITKIASGHNYVDDVCDVCGSEKNIIPEYSTNQLENLKTTITFWHSLDTKEVEILNKIVQQFNEKYPNIKVELVHKGNPENLRDWILKSIRSNSTPTISQTFAGNAIFYNNQNVLSDLREYKNHELYGLTSTQLNDYVDKTYITTEYEVPFTRNMEVMYFNATWFEEHGLLEKYNLGKIINGKFIKNENAGLTWDDIAEIGEYYLTTDEYTSLSDNEKLDNFLDDVDKEKGVTSKSITSTDITTNYNKAAARLEVLKTSRAAYLKALAEATTQGEIIGINDKIEKIAHRTCCCIGTDTSGVYRYDTLSAFFKLSECPAL